MVTDFVPLTRADAEAIRKQAGDVLVGVAETQGTLRLASTPAGHWPVSVAGSVPDLQRVRNWTIRAGAFPQRRRYQAIRQRLPDRADHPSSSLPWHERRGRPVDSGGPLPVARCRCPGSQGSLTDWRRSGRPDDHAHQHLTAETGRSGTHRADCRDGSERGPARSSQGRNRPGLASGPSAPCRRTRTTSTSAACAKWPSSPRSSRRPCKPW